MSTASREEVDAMNVAIRLMTGTRTAGAGLWRLYTRQPASPWVPAAFYGPIAVAGVLGNLIGERPSPWSWVLLPLAGVLLWTLLEYVLHSRGFHGRPGAARLGAVQVSHGAHHDDPKDPAKIVTRLAFSVPIAVVVFLTAWLVMRGLKPAGLLIAGAAVGYLAYEVIHYWIHVGRRTRWLLRPLVKHHLYHHYKDDTRCYGVTTPLWDWIFRTNRPAVGRRGGADTGAEVGAPAQ
jgi:sterol desaturase/sphingolipid hydroxylase (fatty acid hydroxylase superfamily)